MMNHMVYNPLTGLWERINDVDRPVPVIARDTRLVLYNPNTIIVTATNASSNNIDPLGTSGSNPPPTIVLPDAFRIRRVIITALRECTDTLQATLETRVYGRVVNASGNVVNNTWEVGGIGSITGANDGAAFGGVRYTRLVLPSSIAGIFGFDQYRITFSMSNQSGTGEFRLSHIKVYVEM